MTCDLVALIVRAHDPHALTRFWGELLDWPTADELGPEPGSPTTLVPSDDTGFEVRFIASTSAKVTQNQKHFDLTSQAHDQQQDTVSNVLALGGRHLDIGQSGDEGHVVLADPEGNELCVIEPGNRFLADCGFLGAVSCDGSQAVGYFWSQALGWPLVWDQDEETAIRSPRGGPKITWGGPPLEPRIGEDRVLFELTPSPGDDGPDDRAATELDRLLALGATHLESSHADEDVVVLADPDGREFWLRLRSA